MKCVRSLSFILAASAALAFVPALRAAPQGADPAARQIPAVQLSYDGQYLAWIVSGADSSRLVVASWSGNDARDVAVPGGCRATGLRWSPRWYDLAVMTRCTDETGTASPTGAIWVTDITSGQAPRKIAEIDGVAHAMQWSKDLQHIAFLYTPAGSDAQSVASVAVSGGRPEVLTPGDWYVHEFRLSRMGHRIAYTANAPGAGGESQPASLYVQEARAGAAPRLLVDPATVVGPLHDLRITLPRWTAWDAQVAFIAGRPGADGTVGGTLYAIPPEGGRLNHYAFSTNRETVAYWYRFLRHRLFMVTQSAGGTPHFSEFAFNSPGSIRSVRGYFGMAGVMGDGRGPYSVSMSWRHWPRVAFVHGSAGQAPEVHSGLLTPSPPPAVTSINAGTGAVRDPMTPSSPADSGQSGQARATPRD